MRWVLGLAAALIAGCSGGAEAPRQPVPFSHAIHAQKHQIACATCHPGAERGVEAGLPAIASCMSCHMKPQGDSGNDQIVRDRAAKGGPFRWIQVTRNPGHVYFSHRAHTRFAQMECADCHGDVSTWAEPPRSPADHLVDMHACMNCHRERGASNECHVCHR